MPSNRRALLAVLLVPVLQEASQLQFKVTYRCPDGISFVVDRCEVGDKGEFCFFERFRNGQGQGPSYGRPRQLSAQLRPCRAEPSSATPAAAEVARAPATTGAAADVGRAPATTGAAAEVARAPTTTGAAADVARADKYLEAKDFARAIEAYTRALALDNSRFDAYLGLGTACFYAGEYDNALSAISKGIALKPGNASLAEAYRLLSRTNEALRRYSEAASASERAIRLNLKEDLEYWTLGRLYTKTMEFEKAADAYRELVRLRPDDEDALVDLGTIYAISGRKAQALDVHATLVKRKSEKAKGLLADINRPGGAAAILVHLAAVEGFVDKSGAIALLQNALRLKPTDPTVLNQIAFHLGLLDGYLDALAVYRGVIAINPGPDHLADALQGIGRVYNATKEYGLAIPELKRADSIKPDHYTSRMLGEAYVGLEDYPNALAAYQNALRLKGDDAQTLFDIGKTHRALKEIDKAVAAFQEVARLEPKYSRGFNELGRTYFRLRRFADAASALEKAIAINAKDPEMHFGLGMSYRAMGRKADAMRAYETLKALNPGLAQKLLDAIERVK